MRKRTLIIQLLCILVSICALSSLIYPIYADEYGSTASQYKGPYDLSADHNVNVSTGMHNSGPYDTDTMNANLEACYREFLSWGMSRQGACVGTATVYYECGGDITCTENWVPWSDFRYGTTGLGMIGFTFWTLQADLFNIAHSMGKQWTDLSVQLATCKTLFGPETNATYLYDDSLSVDDVMYRFTVDKIRPRDPEIAGVQRAVQARVYYNDPEFEAMTPEAYSDGSSGSQPILDIASLSSITKESDLEGMPSESGLTERVMNLELLGVDSLTDYDKQYNVTVIRETMESKHEFDAWDTVRVIFVFVGLLLLSYALILLMSMLFDNVNSWFDISLVTLFSLGALHYTPDVDVLTNKRHFIGTRRMIAVIATIFVVGALFVSGAILPVVMKWVFKLTQWVSGNG